jgi:D-serine deaminase-like pyridoxal phosphate-dependent protein
VNAVNSAAARLDSRAAKRAAAQRAIIEPAMASSKLMLPEYPWSERYRLSTTENVLTPALVIYPEIASANIACTLALLGGDATRWRAHVKTAKLAYSMRMLVDQGVRSFKCATTLELLVACEAGAQDVLLAYPVIGANARRAIEIASHFPDVRISALAETEEQVRQWRGTSVGIFLDINPGMNRTGVPQEQPNRVIALIRAIHADDLEFRGIHYYDGQYGGLDPHARSAAAHSGYDRLLQLITEIGRKGFEVAEVITAGTPTLPCSLNYEGFRRKEFVHRVSPGTVVYNDATSLAQLPEYGYAPAALVVTRVVSHPSPDIVTCDAGHKSVSADAGLPTCVVMGRPELEPLSPSEEHLPLRVKQNSPAPTIGTTLFLIPRHVCPTVNNFDYALLARNGGVESLEAVSARGREAPLLPTHPKC